VHGGQCSDTVSPNGLSYNNTGGIEDQQTQQSLHGVSFGAPSTSPKEMDALRDFDQFLATLDVNDAGSLDDIGISSFAVDIFSDYFNSVPNNSQSFIP
jgi:hypothetical protein